MIVNLPSYTPPPPTPQILFPNENTHHIISFKKYNTSFKIYQAVAYPEVSRPCMLVFVSKLCAQTKEKLMQNNINFLNHIFNTNASTPSQTFNLSSPLKIVELKILYMPVSVTLDCLNVSQRIVCIIT